MPLDSTWYHATQDVISRSQGRSAVGLAAYVTGERMKNVETGVWSKRNHPGDVMDFGTTVPEGGMEWLTENENLAKAWNAAQNAETRINSQLARHWNFALWSGASVPDHVEVVEGIAQEISDKYGVMVTWAIHKPTEHGDDRNWHGHIAMNMRRVGPDGFGAKAREMVDKRTFTKEMKWVRELIADTINDKLEELGVDERVSHLSYVDRGIDKEPTRHRGNKQNQQELKGRETEVGRENREIEERNRQREQELDQVVRDLAGIDQEITKEEERKLDERYGGDKEHVPPEIDAKAPEPDKDIVEDFDLFRPPAIESDATEAEEDAEPRKIEDDRKRPETPEEAERLLDEGTAPYETQIHMFGEIRQEGFGLTSWEWKAIVAASIHLIEAAVDFVRDKWQQYVADRRGPDNIEPDSPDMER